MDEYDRLVIDIVSEFPGFQLIKKKNSTLMKAANVALLILSLGMMRTFMQSFTTVVFFKVFTPESWDTQDRIATLKHERVHMRQLKRYGRLWFTVSYLFLWFPIGLAYYRKKYEQEAYEESMRHFASKHGITWIESEHYREQMISHFTSAQYLWTWPFRGQIEEWFDDAVAKVRNEMESA